MTLTDFKQKDNTTELKKETEKPESIREDIKKGVEGPISSEGEGYSYVIDGF